MVNSSQSRKPSKPIKTAVITGGHAFDVVNFHTLFRSLDGIDAYVQHLDDFAVAPQAVRDSYDVVLFYIMMRDTPTDEGLPWYAGKPRTALERLGELGQGIVVLHHAILAYPEWPLWNAVVGIQDRQFGFYMDQSLTLNVADDQHPITRGLHDWKMSDETYTMAGAGDGSAVLLTIDHPKSMRTIAWTRVYKKSRVFCFQSGHDNSAYTDPNFRTVLSRGISWAARCL